jgi:DNA polymerase-3 subunit gamma/tau
MDAASQTGIDEVREKIIQASEYMPARCRYKVFVIDEVHDLSAKAFDALLKTIEEPPAHIVFVLATTEYNKVPPTIRSRCQKFEFHRASMQDLIQRLEFVAKSEGVGADGPALYAIARMADGGFRDALTLLEQAIISSDGKITQQGVYDQLGLVTEEVTDKVLELMMAGDIGGLTGELSELSRVGRDPRMILESLLYRLSDLTRVVFRVEEGGDPAHLAASHALAVRLGTDRMLSLRSALAAAHKDIRDISLPRLWLESELIRLSIARPTAVVAAPAPAPAPKPKPAAIPEPAAVVETVVAATNGGSKPEPAKKPAEDTEIETPTPTGNAELDKGQDIWHRTLSGLPKNMPIYAKLSDSKVTDFDEGILHISVTQKLTLDWLNDRKQPRLAFITREVQKIEAEVKKLEFNVTKDGTRKSEPGAVELPAEGPKLAQIAREVFGSVGSQTKDEVT